MRLAVVGSATALLGLILWSGCAPEAKPSVPDDVKLFTPRWAFEPWISKDISTGADMRDFVDGFHQRDIPVGVAVLDSPWETNYNTFIPNEDRYPAFAQYVADLRDQGVRTVLWTTQMVNESSFDLEPGGGTYQGPSPNFQEGEDKNFFVNEGKTTLWWKGTGAGLDFFNPDARTWWHEQQKVLLATGVAGFKLDFGEQYFGNEFIGGALIKTHDGGKSLQEYSEAYYRDFLENGVRTVVGGANEFLIMPRPYDESYGFPPRFFARPGDAPVTWVGDQTQDWEGLHTALDHIFESAHAGYAVIGSDIGGYLDTKNGATLPFDIDVFHAWTAMSALTPLFQLHGRANLAPWTVPGNADVVDDTVAQYRYWATLHHALSRFFFSLTREAQLKTPPRAKPNEGAVPVLHVVGDDFAAWHEDWRFSVGDALFVAPLVEAGGARTVALPARDDDAGYVDWWHLDAPAVAGGTSLSFVAPSSREIPLYAIEGAIVPLVVDSDALGPAIAPPDAHAYQGLLTILCFPGPRETQLVMHDDDDATGTITLSADAVHLVDLPGRTVLRVKRNGRAVAGVTVNGVAATSTTDRNALAAGPPSFSVDAAGDALWIGVPDGAHADIAFP